MGSLHFLILLFSLRLSLPLFLFAWRLETVRETNLVKQQGYRYRIQKVVPIKSAYEHKDSDDFMLFLTPLV